METDSSSYIFMVAFVYLLGALTVVLWAYLTTKIVFSIFSKERVALRVISWLIVGWILAVVLYMTFLISIGVLGIAAQSLIDLLK